MSEPADPTSFNVEFLKTFLSVIAGGVISLGSILIVEWVKRGKEKQEKKRVLYNKLISSINSIRRYEINCLEHGMAFNYHKTIYRIDESNAHAKSQGEYHQQKRDEGVSLLFEKVEALDMHAIDFEILCGNDESFKELIENINQWPRPDLSRFNDVTSISDLNDKYEVEIEDKLSFTSDYWNKAVNKVHLHIYKKLL